MVIDKVNKVMSKKVYVDTLSCESDKKVGSDSTIFDNVDSYSRFKEFLWILHQADKRCLEELLGKRIERNVELNSQIEKSDRKIFQRKIVRSSKNYNLTQVAHLLNVHRQTIYYWIKKSWLKPKRDSRNYPFCTVLDIESLMKWRNSVKKEVEKSL